MSAAVLHLLAVDARRRLSRNNASLDLVATLVVHVLDVESVDMAGEVSVMYKYAE